LQDGQDLLHIVFQRRLDIEPEAGKHFSENFSRPRFARKYSISARVYRRLSARDSPRQKSRENMIGDTSPRFDPFPDLVHNFRLHTLESFLSQSQY
jgi:hypothetical protein